MLVQLSCRSFRNLAVIEWCPPPGHQLLLGANGAGKTSLLEAIYLLATTRSFRTPRLADCCRDGASSFLIEGEVDSGRRAALAVGWGAQGGVRRLNGSSGSLVEHLSMQPVVAWTSGQQELFSGAPSQRRRFVDQGVVSVQPRALEAFSRYRRALMQKRRLLEVGGRGLAAWNGLLARAASEVMALRQDYLNELGRAAEAVVSAGAGSLPKVGLRYRPSLEQGVSPERALAALNAATGREREQRRPLLGPHRDEVEIRWEGQPVRRRASAGERKAAGLILTAARGRVLEARGRAPIYLLDDIDSELDEARCGAAWKLFAGAQQVFASSSRVEIWGQAEGVHRWHLAGGRLAPARGGRRRA